MDLIRKTAAAPLLPVIKANAYGHGAVTIARELLKRRDVAALCVGSVGEALELRREGIKSRIIVLDGVFREQARDVARYGLEAVVSSVAEARALASAAGRERIGVHFKINTGMTRLGANGDKALGAYKKIAGMKKIYPAGLMTHLAEANKKRGATSRQVSQFEQALSAIRGSGFELPPIHAANTAAIFLHPKARYDAARPGLGVYGVQEFSGADVGLLPILSWRARIIMARDVAKNTPVSYGAIWVSPGRRRVAVAYAGYADGFSRRMSNKAVAVFKGKKIRQVGAICMDNCLFDVTGTDAKAGDTITLIGDDGGRSIRANDLARWSGTISYEILCGIGRRAPRVYLKNGKAVKTVAEL